MTFWWSEDNYGQLLQCYALQKYLRDLGHDAYLIRYDARNDGITPLCKKIFKAFNPIKLCKFILVRNRLKYDKLEKQKNPREFEKFRKKNINQSQKLYKSYFELKENPPEADIYIVGSDQVWNINSNRFPNDKTRAYCLDFGDSSIKRIAYAASFGKTQLDNLSISQFTPLLKRFNYISVREESGIGLCKKCSIENAELMPDPTLLLNIEIYRSLYKGEEIRKPDKPFCFLYLLGNEYSFSIKDIYNWAKTMGLEVIYVTGNLQHDKFKKQYATIPEWIYLIEHAEYVITNSYHCSIFSLLFKKTFGVIPLKGGYKGMNTRFDTLFNLFKIKKQYINNDINHSFQGEQIDWNIIDIRQKQIINSCKLNMVIEGNYPPP